MATRAGPPRIRGGTSHVTKEEGRRRLGRAGSSWRRVPGGSSCSARCRRGEPSMRQFVREYVQPEVRQRGRQRGFRRHRRDREAVILAAAAPRTTEDWSANLQGAVSDFYAAGLMNPTLNQYYGSEGSTSSSTSRAASTVASAWALRPARGRAPRSPSSHAGKRPTLPGSMTRLPLAAAMYRTSAVATPSTRRRTCLPPLGLEAISPPRPSRSIRRELSPTTRCGSSSPASLLPLVTTTLAGP